MKKMVILHIIIGIGVVVQAQKYYISNLYMYDMFLMNPANAGSDKDCYSFGLFYQNQWLGMEDSPTTQIFNAQGPLSKSLGFGTYVYNDRNGNMKEFGLHQSLSYEVLLGKSRRHISKLAFGLAFSVEQSSIDESNFQNNTTIIDPLIHGGISSGWGYNSNAGVIFMYDDYHIGFSVTNMLNQTNPLYKGDGEPGLPMDWHLFLSGMYKVVDRDVFLEPMVMVRGNSETDKRVDLSLKGTFPTPNPMYALWGLVAYRRTMDDNFGKSLGMAATMGVNYQRISLGLEYQLGLTRAQLEYGSAYQLVLRYTICNNLKHHAIPCSEARKNKKSRYSGMIWY
ncbi:PorP/SprF family type IX secretion system membrane protein [Plebeiibacterium marinum]|uniref:PorP/SprF family type IX secretion system membrane protein n=1 Tax=Plebeiibacterium marinum TaxID=2992111 RepID=A0AAE3MDN1_9BACT|nr:PorP/SprF family type IX secretion system membrane protein [Plebeiobacterium marinum]MCW3805619.1 PorP/SprF family type IX secretion system membrane protein [Plebeiobacterium marinum]